MKPGELAAWLKQTQRFGKVTCLRVNGDDDRCIALSASSKRYTSAERVVRDIPGVTLVEALDGNRQIVATFVVAGGAAARDPLEEKAPDSPAGLMAAYARHIATAYKDGGEAVGAAYQVSFSELTGLVKLIAQRLAHLEMAWMRTLNAQAKAIEEAQPGGDEDATINGVFGQVIAAKLAQQNAKPNGGA